jgi:hypothetical protein
MQVKTHANQIAKSARPWAMAPTGAWCVASAAWDAGARPGAGGARFTGGGDAGGTARSGSMMLSLSAGGSDGHPNRGARASARGWFRSPLAGPDPRHAAARSHHATRPAGGRCVVVVVSYGCAAPLTRVLADTGRLAAAMSCA